MWRRSGRGFLWKRRATCEKVKLEIDEIMGGIQSVYLKTIQQVQFLTHSVSKMREHVIQSSMG